ncbi:interleukin-22 receptor subunit alpha-2 [Syngnathus scovelli]|uniref:interleukin-22 receptor subunit alpha-2 n=1 Tax=Syngnathus scovelli TaxID=161590 RepID=UPI0021108B2A|nr:interleukin-22 receptor subunit alpha-2 [Syngnathus scovelli]
MFKKHLVILHMDFCKNTWPVVYKLRTERGSGWLLKVGGCRFRLTVGKMNRVLIGGLLLLNIATVAVSKVLPAPAHVKFDSVDFKNVLHWMPPANCSNLRYNVQWKIYGDAQWRDVDSCQGVRESHCDLSGVMSDLQEWYYARVRASSSSSSLNNSAWILSPRFSPRWDTKISAPLLRLNVSEQGIVVHVRTPQPLAKKMQKSRLHVTLVYVVYLLNEAGKEEMFELLCCSRKFVMSKVEHKTKYCFQAQSVAELQGHRSARGPKKCITTT